MKNNLPDNGQLYGLSLAHIGLAVENIDSGADTMRLLTAKAVTPVIEDPVQQAFLQMYLSGNTYIELIAPSSEDSHVVKMLSGQPSVLAHMCFQTDDISASIDHINNSGGLVFKGPAPAKLFGGKQVAFAMLSNRMIVEIVENGWLENMPQL